jgi:hypothetical protein
LNSDMTTYMAVIGLYQACVVGKANAPLPPKLYASKHIDDWAQGHLVALTCDTAAKYASSKAKSAMHTFSKPRFLERHIRSRSVAGPSEA